MFWRICATIVLCTSIASEASARQLRAPTVGRGGGLLGDDSARIQAIDLGRRLGLPCEIGQVRYRGLTITNASTFEVVCREGGGYVLIDDPENRLVDCAALQRGPPASACRLPGAANIIPTVKRYATSAGLTCLVDDARVVGLARGGRLTYEAGCRGHAGAWLTASPNGWQATDCLRIEARGDRCLLTTEAERLASLSDWVASEACSPEVYRYMGESGANTVFEIRCKMNMGYVLRLNAANHVQEKVSCDLAEFIGHGCRLSQAVEPNIQ